MKESIIRIIGMVIVCMMFYAILRLGYNAPPWASFSFGMIMANLILKNK